MIDTPDADPPLLPGSLQGARVDVAPFGEFELTRHLERGLLHDVYEARGFGEQALVIKTPTPVQPDPDANLPAFSTRFSGEGTSLWGGSTGGATELADRRIRHALLDLEACTIALTNGAWNHRCYGVGSFDPEPQQRAPSELAEGLAPALVMPLHPGVSLGALDRELARWLFAPMLPAIWDALALVRHGDLDLDCFVFEPGDRHLVILDPGVVLSRQRQGAAPESWADQRVLALTNASQYPLLSPTYRPSSLMASGGRLADHLRALLTVARVGPLLSPCPARTGGTPSLPDQLALGILWYRLLTGRHPFFAPGEAMIPAWTGNFLEVGQSARERMAAALARVEAGVIPPRELASNVTDAEQRLCLALLDLRISNRAELVAMLLG